jgi:capsular polysaccharide transport system ATP-binding protein
MKLEFQKVCHIHDRKKQIYNLLDVDITIQETSTAILSTQSRSAKALLKLISGIEVPTRGRVIRSGGFSPPINEISYFHKALSGEQNINFIARIYGQNPAQLIEKVKKFARLNNELKQKTETYSLLLKRKIILSTNILMQFDVYQLSGPITHPQNQFNNKLQKKLTEISENSYLIIASNNKDFLNKYAKSALIIDKTGRAELSNSLNDGLKKLEQLNKE